MEERGGGDEKKGESPGLWVSGSLPEASSRPPASGTHIDDLFGEG